MQFQAKHFWIVGVAVLFLLVGGGLWWKTQQAPHPSAALLGQIQTTQGTKDAYALAQKGEQLIAKDAGNVEGYVNAGNNYKAIADQLHNDEAFHLAVYYYETGVQRLGTRSTVLLNNLGNVYQAMQDYPRAIRAYKKSIESNPGDPAAYLALLTLYQEKTHPPTTDILALYKQALETLVDNTRVVQMLAEYLQSIGHSQEALQYYQLLQKRFPGQFDSDIQKVEASIAASSSVH